MSSGQREAELSLGGGDIQPQAKAVLFRENLWRGPQAFNEVTTPLKSVCGDTEQRTQWRQHITAPEDQRDWGYVQLLDLQKSSPNLHKSSQSDFRIQDKS